MSYASVSDVTARWEGSASEGRIQAALDDAHVLLSAKVLAATGSTLDEWVTAGSTDAAMVRIVLIRMVTRNLDNPKGFLAEHAGEYGYSYGSTKTAAAAGRISATDDDLADLGISIVPVGSIRLATPQGLSCAPVYPSEREAATGWCW